MKNIDIKSLIIGVLLTSTIFLGVAAVANNAATEVSFVDRFGRPMETIAVKIVK